MNDDVTLFETLLGLIIVTILVTGFFALLSIPIILLASIVWIFFT